MSTSPRLLGLAAAGCAAGLLFSSSCTEPPIANPCVCGVLEVCIDGLCQGQTGAACGDDATCVSKHCACADAACAARACAPQACLCAQVDAAGACGAELANGTMDPGACDGASACFGGVCRLRNTQACQADAACGGGFCECTDATCAQRACAASDCLCSYGPAGACTTYLNSGSIDFGDCEGTRACFGGACLSVDAQPCVSDADCGSGQCECADANCDIRLCAGADCVCRYGPANDPCVNALAEGAKDSPDCLGTHSCYAGACKGDLAASCAADAECGSGSCECTNSDCTTRVCAAVDCLCTVYDATAQTCAGPLNDSAVDPGDCEAEHACWAGSCKLAVGQPCTADADCGSAQCECIDATCSARVCAGANCVCGYDAAGGCTTALPDGTEDPQDCTSRHACWGGVCKVKLGAPCEADAECNSGFCECITAECGRAVCASASCTCKYGAAGACTTNMPAGSKDLGDCDATYQTCCGDGTCSGAGGALCTGNANCCSGACVLGPPPLRIGHCSG